MTVLEPGPGMGFFTLEMARLVGPKGRVVAVDIQKQMLSTLGRRARRRGLDSRIELRLADASGMGTGNLARKVDFVLAFAVVHEMPDGRAFFKEAFASLRKGGKMLFAEPSNHIDEQEFTKSVEYARKAGFEVEGTPKLKSNHSALLTKRIA
jgi:ubiquinone/menaquinone biosynthesis C-methylase UbiE